MTDPRVARAVEAVRRGETLPFDGFEPPPAPRWHGVAVGIADHGTPDRVPDELTHQARANALRAWAADPAGHYWAPGTLTVEVISDERFAYPDRWTIRVTVTGYPLVHLMPDYVAFRAEVAQALQENASDE